MTVYVLMDGRAAMDTDAASILDAGTAEEMCRAANNGNHGKGCLVVDDKSNVMWEWLASGRWVAPKKVEA